MAAAAVDILGLLPGPATKLNAGACDLLAGEVFAYAVSAAVAVVDVRRVQLACVLQGPHRNAAVTAVSWCPDLQSRSPKDTAALRLASGDSEGRVVLWDVTGGAPEASLEDPAQAAAGGSRRNEAAKSGVVRDLAWVMPEPALLAVALANGLLILWDTRGGGIVWKKEFGAEASLASICVDPSDARRICVAGNRGSLTVLRFAPVVTRGANDAPAAGHPGDGAARELKVAESQTYQVDVKAGDTLRCGISATRDLLFVLLPRELVVFDLEFGQPAASTSLPASRPAFRGLLGSFGHAAAGVQPQEAGIDFLYCSHQDNSVSVWSRNTDALSYIMLGLHKLTPPPSRINNNQSLNLLCMAACPWLQGVPDPPGRPIVLPLDAGKTPPVVTPEQTQGAALSATQSLAPKTSGLSPSVKRTRSCVPLLVAEGSLPVGALTPRFSSPRSSFHDPLAGTAPAQPLDNGSSLDQHELRRINRRASTDRSIEQQKGIAVARPQERPSSPFDKPDRPSSPFDKPDRPNSPFDKPDRPNSLFDKPDRPSSPFDKPEPPPQQQQQQPKPVAESADASAVVCSGGGAKAKRAVQHSLLLMTVTDVGHVWQWCMPLQSLSAPTTGLPKASPGPQRTPPASPDKPPPRETRPSLLGILHTLPHPVTTFSICPSPVGVGVAGVPAGPPSSMSGPGGDAVAVIAAVTSAGNVELVTVQRGALMPLMGTVSVSLGAHKDIVRGVRWLGPTARIVSFSSERLPNSAAFRNTLLLTDARSRASLPFREVGGEDAPMMGVRSSPSGRYLLVLLRGAPSEIWAVGGFSRPHRVRVLDLPFTAVEWVLPTELSQSLPATPTRWMVWQRSPRAVARVSSGLWDVDDPHSGGGTPLGPSGGSLGGLGGEEEYPEERLAFALADGRVGVLAVKARKVSDTKPKRPSWSGLPLGGDNIATAVAALGYTVVLGDKEGNLHRWELATGRVSTFPVGQGPVRRIHFAPAAASELAHAKAGSLDGFARPAPASPRIAVMFSTGAFGTWELGSGNDLRQGSVSVAASLRVGKVIDLAWLPLPAPVGGGSVLAVAAEDGTLAMVDAAQPVEQRTRKQRLAAFRHLLGGVWPFPLGGLSPPAPLGGSLLLPRAWSLLLRLLLQSGVPPATLRSLSGPPQSYCETLEAATQDDRELEEAIWACLPHDAIDSWLDNPHRVVSFGAQALQELVKRTTTQDEAAGSRRISDAWDASWEFEPSSKMTSSVRQPSALGVSRLPTGGSLGLSREESQQSEAEPPGPTYDNSISTVPTVGGDGSGGSRAFRQQGDANGGLQGQPRGYGLQGELPAGGIRKKGWKDRLGKMANAGATALKGLAAGNAPPPDSSLAAASAAMTAAQSIAHGTISAEEEHPADLTYAASLATVLRALAHSRACRKLLFEREWLAYERAVASGSTAARMEVAAAVAGEQEEARFWRGLPATLAMLRSQVPSSALRTPAGNPLEGLESRLASHSSSRRHTRDDEPAEAAVLAEEGSRQGGQEGWLEGRDIAEARERAAWHEAMHRRNASTSEKLQERRVLEYVVLRDFQTAVGFLLASTPEKSARYYRDALCTLALAAAGTEADQGSQQQQQQQTTAGETVSRTLHIQAAKVVTAHAASVGDALLGVPLLCSAGLAAEAVALLQDARLWRYAATLTAHSLRAAERAAALERWATHIHQEEGRLWQACGVLAAAGALRSVVLLLRRLSMPDCAAAFVRACTEAGLKLDPRGPLDSGGIENLFHHTGNTPMRRSVSIATSGWPAGHDVNAVDAEYVQYCRQILQQL